MTAQKKTYKKHTTETFVESVRDSYPDFDFSRVVFTKMKDKVQVTCMKHDFDFEMLAYDLSRGRNSCPLCGGKKMTTEQFIMFSQKTHGDKYDYASTVLIKRTEHVKISCKTHGEFSQFPILHLKGAEGCPDCNGQKPITPGVFIERSKKVHGAKTFDYSHLPEAFDNAIHTKVDLKCRKHEEWFNHSAWSNLRGMNGCSKCSPNTPVTLEEVMRRGKEAFPDKDYDYSQVNLSKGITNKVKIGCPVEGHGFFYQNLGNHLYHGKEGCIPCDKIQRIATVDDFIKRSQEVHGVDTYTYEKTVLSNGLRGRVIITCPEEKHGDFEVEIAYHIRGGSPCPKCKLWGVSTPELELLAFVESFGYRAIMSDRTILKPQEIDVYIPELKLGFEFNGIYWHSDEFKSPSFHEDKRLKAHEAGVRLVNVWEDDWRDKRTLMENHIAGLLDAHMDSVPLDGCHVIEVEPLGAEEFSQETDVRGFSSEANRFVGLEYEGNLVSLASFKDSQLVRFSYSRHVEGSLDVLCEDINDVYVDADLDYWDERLFSGWKRVSDLGMTPWYVFRNTRFHESEYRRERFKEDPKLIWEEELNDLELARLNGLSLLWDAGKVRFVK